MRQLVLHRLAQILDQVETVGDLFGTRRPSASTLGIDTVAIPADDPDSGMFPQPCREGSRRTIRQQIGHDPLLQIHQDRSIAVASFPPCPVIY